MKVGLRRIMRLVAPKAASSVSSSMRGATIGTVGMTMASKGAIRASTASIQAERAASTSI